MSKKKNTLKDLDQFLKQQAASLVTPPRLNQADHQQTPSEEGSQLEPVNEIDEDISAEKILSDLQLLARKEGPRFRHQLYDLLITSVESQNEYSPEDRMLINTALYLKSGSQWKDVIREYWRGKNQVK